MLSSLKPTVTFSPSVIIGRLMSIPFDARYATISSRVASFSLSFIFSSRYTFPLVLKNFLVLTHFVLSTVLSLIVVEFPLQYGLIEKRYHVLLTISSPSYTYHN